MYRTKNTQDPMFTEVIKLELASIEPSLAGPKRPQDRVALKEVKNGFTQSMDKEFDKSAEMDKRVPVEGRQHTLGNGDVVIAAITSCTNTSNPSVMIAAGLVARKAVAKGLTVKPWVKTSLAPGSQVVEEYFAKSGLQKYLDALGFNLVGFGCTTCIGNSGPLPEEISEAINKNDLVAAAVLSGNRNFEGRVNADVRANYLASPPLVVAYALAGSMQIDVAKQPLGIDQKGRKVYLRDIWPSNREIAVRHQEEHQQADVLAQIRRRVQRRRQLAQDQCARRAHLQMGRPFHLRAEPALLRGHGEAHPPDRGHRRRAHPRPVPRFDHDRPHLAGRLDQGRKPGRRISARPSSPAEGLQSIRHAARQSSGDDARHLRQYPHQEPDAAGCRRRLHDPLSGRQRMPIYDAAMRYKTEHVPLVVFAGKEYGTGSSRDWAAKGSILLGIRAVIAQSFERIHRSNLVGMGVVPLVFEEGTSWQTLGLKGDEQVTIRGLHGDLKPHQRCRPKSSRPTAVSSGCR